MARLAITSLAFMFDDVPEPVWKTSIGKWSSQSPRATSTAASWIALAVSLSITLRRPFTVADAPLIDASAPISARSIGRPEIGKFSTARCVCACHRAQAGTFTSPIESCSMRNSSRSSTPRNVAAPRVLPMRKATMILVVFLLAACGGGSSDISKEDFLAEADKICEEGDAKIEADTADLDIESMSEDEIADAIKDIVIPNIREQISDIRDLGFPKDDADELDAIFDDAEDVLDAGEEDPSTFISGDPFADVNVQLSDYGFTNCGGT